MTDTNTQADVVPLDEAETPARVRRLRRWALDHHLTPIRRGGLWCLHTIGWNGKAYPKPEFGPASIGACEADLRSLDQERWEHWCEDGCHGEEPGFEGLSPDAIAAKWAQTFGDVAMPTPQPFRLAEFKAYHQRLTERVLTPFRPANGPLK